MVISRVFRMQHADSKVGPYSLCAQRPDLDRQIDGGTSEHKPFPWHDGLVDGLVFGDRFGCLSLECLREWFSVRDRAALYANGCAVYAFAIMPQDVRRGGRQVIFNAPRALWEEPTECETME